MPPTPKPDPEKFWPKVDRSGDCWLWTGGLSQKGYGRFKTGGRLEPKTIAAHRWVWEQESGPIPEGGMICHHCDVRHCVRPSHLYLGDAKTNAADRDRRGRRTRGFRGEENGHARLSREDVEEIRRRYTGRRGQQTEIAQEYGVTRGTISHIIMGRSWTNLPVPTG